MIDNKSPLERLRLNGWSVAVHNDYVLHGEPFTCWLMTHPEGIWIRGEGRTDEAALAPLPPLAYERLRELRDCRKAGGL